MNLLSRLIRLENRANAPEKPVHLIFQQVGESDEKVASRIKAENHGPEAILIMVKFIKTLDLQISRVKGGFLLMDFIANSFTQ